MGKVIIIMGITCSGKDTILNKLVDRGCHRLVSHTTRPIRLGETNHISYHFVTKEQFDSDLVNDEIIEHREYNVADGNTWYYYFKKEELDLTTESYVCIADVHGSKELIKYFGEVNTKVILVDTPVQECIERALLRDGTEVNKIKETCRRIVSDIEEFIEIDDARAIATYVHKNESMSSDKLFNNLIALFEYIDEGEDNNV